MAELFREPAYVRGGLSTGMAIADKQRELEKQRGLASGAQAYVDAETAGDKAGMRKALGVMAGVAPVETMNWINQQKALEQKNLERSFNTTNERKNVEYLMSLGIPQQKAIDMAYKQTDNDPYTRTLKQEQAKNDIEIARGDEDFKKMSPSVIGALERAKKSLNSGSGVGPFGGYMTKIGLNKLPNAAANYANVESANTQMNQLLRAKLKATGLTGSELNSAVEANAYRYTISPTDNEGVVLQKIKNFETDILGIGNQQQEQPKKSKYTIVEVK